MHGPRRRHTYAYHAYRVCSYTCVHIHAPTHIFVYLPPAPCLRKFGSAMVHALLYHRLQVTGGKKACVNTGQERQKQSLSRLTQSLLAKSLCEQRKTRKNTHTRRRAHTHILTHHTHGLYTHALKEVLCVRLYIIKKNTFYCLCVWQDIQGAHRRTHSVDNHGEHIL